MDPTALLQAILAKCPSLAEEAGAALSRVNGGRQAALNVLIPRALAIQPDPFDAATREALARGVVAVDGGADRGKPVGSEAELPRTRISAEQFDRLRQEADAAGLTTSRYIRWRLFG